MIEIVTSSVEQSTARQSATGEPRITHSNASTKIWIDLENSPHIPFFKPIVDELERRGHRVFLTARDCFQVRELADLFGLRYHLIGRHYGKNRIAKVAGLAIRALQAAPQVLREKPDLAVSHGSRSMFALSSLLKIPTITIFDYEHAQWTGAGKCSWCVVPEVFPAKGLHAAGYVESHILRYPGIKEDVYVPSFRPDPSIKRQLGLSDDDLVVTVRPPASEAHYHNPEAEKLLSAVFRMVSREPRARIVLLPRTHDQETELREQWPELFEKKTVIVPKHAVDGLDLIWFSDLVISGGGTMNREAAALGVPVFSIFRGKTGAVDEYLVTTGRLVMLASEEDVISKVKLVSRKVADRPQIKQDRTLQVVVDHISRVAETVCSTKKR